ncbi:AraC family transcriptional regulator [Blautia sp. Sow4_E7]|uniref:helix-turn-helix transcriptional regulator n=1 Tax=Blautia sp. Sow4_E7 TaxID=3438749 RepID=UPI003F91AEBC
MSTRSFSFSNENPLSTEAVLVNASSSRYEEDWPSIPHTHAFTELFYVSRGSGEFLIEDQRFSIEKDDLIIVNPHIQHTETSQSSMPLTYYTVGVDGISFSFRDQREFQIFNCRKIGTDLLFYFHSLFQELDEKKEGYEEICRHTLSILIAQLRRITDSGFQLVPSFHPSKECALIKRYLDYNYGEDINLDQLAALSHLNKYYLSHEFTRYYGISPINYLNRRRIEVCKNLLENTDHDISDIAHLAGFSSQSYLAQSFRKYCGMTAMEYRRSKHQ